MKIRVSCFSLGLAFAPRDLNVWVSFTRYRTPV